MQIRNNVTMIQGEMISALVELIKIPSVIDETNELRPFGIEIDNALKKEIGRAHV